MPGAPPTRIRVASILRALWVFVVIWFEVGIFHYAIADCHWPRQAEHESLPTSSSSDAHHILIIADPQILDQHSYPDRPPYLVALTQFFTDLNLRRNWRAAIRTRPHAVVVLGDLMDGGRGVIDPDEYERYYRRFKSIFSHPSLMPVYYMPGNHDVGLGNSTHFSTDAHFRFITHFGPLNQRVRIGNHTLVMIDALGLVEEDYRRSQLGFEYDKWQALSGGAVEFVREFAKSKGSHPVILFSHIPLWRPLGSSCGPLREGGILRPGGGFGYQNMLGRETTTFILDNIRPAAVFSGDDHDYCEYSHHTPYAGHTPHPPIKEVTVKSLSMAMGILRPGFQLLALYPDSQTHEDRPCLLPAQMQTYVRVYAPLLVVSLGVLFVANARRPRKSVPPFSIDLEARPRAAGRAASGRQMSSFPMTSRTSRAHPGNTYDRSDTGDEIDFGSSKPSSRPRGRLWGRFLFIADWMASVLCRSKQRRRRRGLLTQLAEDVRDTAMLPVVLWIVFVLWSFL